MDKSNFSHKITLEEARIAAHVCGDGYLCLYKCKRSVSDLAHHKRKDAYRNIFQIGYCNTELSLLNTFQSDILKVFTLKTRLMKGNTIVFNSKRAFERIQFLGGGKSRSWFISKEIINANKNAQIEWIKAFFDDEAYVEINNNRLCVNSVNKEGLKQVQKMLQNLGIKHVTFNGPYSCAYRDKECISFRLTVLKRSVKDYAKIIGFAHPQKIQKLKEIILKIK